MAGCKKQVTKEYLGVQGGKESNKKKLGGGIKERKLLMIRKIVLKKGKIKDLTTCQQKIMPLKKAIKNQERSL